MAFPDLSHEQELLKAPIPFANRVEFISDFLKLHPQRETAPYIAKKLEVTEDRVVNMANAVGATFAVARNGEVKYEPYTREVIEEEMQWVALITELDELLPVTTIADCLAKSKKWVKEHLVGLNIYPEIIEKTMYGTLRRIEVYPKEVIMALRTIMLHFPPANDWFSPTEAEALVGKTKEWIDLRVRVMRLKTQLRVSSSTQRITVHYDPETVRVLQELAANVPPAGDWLTVQQIAQSLSADKNWIAARIQSYEDTATILLDDTGREQMHYPPYVVEEMGLLLEARPATAGDWMTVSGMARILGADPDWVKNRVQPYQSLAEVRLSEAGKGSHIEAVHYPPSVLVELSKAREAFLKPADDWMTVNAMAGLLGKSYKWVKQRVDSQFAECAEQRVVSGGTSLASHYPPSVYEALKGAV